MTTPNAVAGTNLEFARSHNRRAVLEAIRANGPLTRAEIARLTALTPQTVSNIAAELEAAGLLKCLGRRHPGRGQPASPYAIDEAGAFSIGLQLDHERMIGVLADLGGTVRAHSRDAFPERDPERGIAAAAAMADRLVAAAGIDRDRLLGIGIAMPGPFGVSPLNLGPTGMGAWQGFPVAERLSRLTGLSVAVENDARAAAIGERLYGSARALRSFVYLFVGLGLGAGLFLDGAIYQGSDGNAGELGHMVVVPDGRPCPCGNRGCLERYLSLQAAYEAVGISAAEDAPERLAALLAAADPALDAWLAEAAQYLRLAVNILESLFDPDTIIVGGPMPAALLERMIAGLPPLFASGSARPGRPMARVLAGGVGGDVAPLGGAALPVFDELNPRFEALLKPQPARAAGLRGMRLRHRS